MEDAEFEIGYWNSYDEEYDYTYPPSSLVNNLDRYDENNQPLAASGLWINYRPVDLTGAAFGRFSMILGDGWLSGAQRRYGPNDSFSHTSLDGYLQFDINFSTASISNSSLTLTANESSQFWNVSFDGVSHLQDNILVVDGNKIQ